MIFCQALFSLEKNYTKKKKKKIKMLSATVMSNNLRVLNDMQVESVALFHSSR